MDETPSRTTEILALHDERVVVSTRVVERAVVRVSTVTTSHERLVEEALSQERVTIEHVPVGRFVDAAPDVRTEGDLTIVPVVEEVVVVERRLRLKEEIHIRRVRQTEPHIETVVLRTQDATVTRTPIARTAAGTPPSDLPPTPPARADIMTEETIVAVFDTAAHADAAVRDLEAAGVPTGSISRHGGTGAATGTAATGTVAGEPVRERGFWSSLFGGEPDHDTAVYDRSVESGSSVVTVKTPAEHIESVTAILERNNPIDIDERAAGYGLGTAATARTAATATAATTGTYAGTAPAQATGVTGNEAVISLSEEQIAVGKRLVDRGTTRVRRFVVETPVEENVSLHSERVSIERRPVSGGVVANPDFSDRVIEVRETDEEAVVAKTAHVVEEVVVHKDASDRVETIHDTVRREDVEITREGGVGTATTAPGVLPTDRSKI